MTARIAVVDAAVTTELRRAVLRPHWPVGTPMHGDDLPEAVHLAAFDGAAVVGACVLIPARYAGLPDEAAAWQLRGMATADGRRGAGIGAAVVRGAVDAVTARRATLLWCKARVVAVAFYERNGFVVDTEEYVEPQTGLPHRDMHRVLPRDMHRVLPR